MAVLGKVACNNVLIAAWVLALAGPPAMAASSEQADTGELRIEGEHITHLVLRNDDGRSEVFDSPGKSMTLPEGTYTLSDVEVAGGYRYMSRSNRQAGQVTIRHDEPAVLKIGGPLKPSVEAVRRGRVLLLNFQITGIGGESYIGPRSDDQRPAFAVYQGDRKIATGQFEYG